MLAVLKGLDELAGIEEVAWVGLLKFLHVGDRNQDDRSVVVVNRNFSAAPFTTLQ